MVHVTTVLPPNQTVLPEVGVPIIGTPVLRVQSSSCSPTLLATLTKDVALAWDLQTLSQSRWLPPEGD